MGLYGPVVDANRESFQEELGAVRGLWEGHWTLVFGGDFDLVHSLVKHRRGGRISPSMRRFSEVIDDMEQKDIPLQGGCLTRKGVQTATLCLN